MGREALRLVDQRRVVPPCALAQEVERRRRVLELAERRRRVLELAVVVGPAHAVGVAPYPAVRTLYTTPNIIPCKKRHCDRLGLGDRH